MFPKSVISAQTIQESGISANGETDRRSRKARWERWWRNVWFYHKNHLIIGSIAALIGTYFAWQSAALIPADYTIAWVSGRMLDSDESNDIAAQFALYGEDQNGDGTIQVTLHQIQLDLQLLAARGTEGQKELGQLMALEADLDSCQSVLYLTDNPQALWEYTGALLYTDGTQPASDATDWDKMVIPWELPASVTSSANAKGANPPLRMYLGCRGCWKEKQHETWLRSWQLWHRILETTQNKAE